MPLRNVATTFTIEQQRLEINNLAGDVNNIATGATTVGTATTATALAAGATGADLTLSGTLTVNGTQTILNTATLEVEDKNIVIAKGSTTDAAASGGGITLKGADDKTISYNQTGDKWVSNKDFEAPNLIGAVSGVTGSPATVAGNLQFIQGTPELEFNNGGARLTVQAANSLSVHTGGGIGTTTSEVARFTNTGLSVTGGLLETQGGQEYTASASSLATSVTKAALRVKGSSNSSDSLFMGVETTDANPYIQGSNGVGNLAKKLLLNPFGGNVGVGTVEPNRELEVYNNASQCSVAITAATTGQSSLWFADTADINVGGIYYEHSNDAMGFRVDNGSDKLRITNDKVMVGVDLKCDAHHSRDIGTASNAFRDIYSQTLTASTVYDGRGNIRRITGVNPSGVYDVVAGDGGTQGRYIFTSDNVRLANGMTGGDVITIINNGSSDITIDAATNSVTLTNSADASTGDRTLASKGMATVLYVGSATAFISGAGLS